MIISLIICTRNRYRLVSRCLNSIAKQTNHSNKDKFEVLLIDNNSSDNTQLLENQKYGFIFRYIREKKVGLSIARNTALKHAKGEYTIFIDDDAYLSSTYIREAIRFLENNKEVEIMFGGPYRSYYEDKPPKWFPKNFGCWTLGRKIRTINIGVEFITGLNFGFTTELKNKIGGFDTKLGMQGDKMGYGEEVNFQLNAASCGIKAVYVPKMLVYHLVPKYKQSIKWLLKSSYKTGQDAKNTFEIRRSIYQKIYSVIVSILLVPFKILVNFKKPPIYNIYCSLKDLCYTLGELFSK